MASVLQIQGFCETCNQQRLFTKTGTNHLVHGLVSLFLCGLWIPIWILASALNAAEPYRCTQCGSSSKSEGATAVAAFVAAALAALLVLGVAIFALGNATHTAKERRTRAAEAANSQQSTQALWKVTPEEDAARAERQAMEAQARALREAAEKRANALADNTLKYHQELADKGDAYGQYKMGLRYMNGDGVEKDWFKASDYLGKAAVQGRTDAAAELQKLLAATASHTN